MPIISPPPLPVERFEEFKRFALTVDPTGCANAAGTALSVQHMLGVAIVGPDAKDEALRLWAADFGTDQWREASERAQRAAEQALPYAFSFGFGIPLQGWGQAAYTVPRGRILELNSWMRWALSQFYDACNETPGSALSASIQSPAVESTPPTPVAKRVRAASGLDSIVKQMRKMTAEDLLAIKVDDLPNRFGGSRSQCYRARRQVLAEFAASTPGQPG